MATPAQKIGVSQGSNRLNSSGSSLGTVKNRSSQFITNIVPAGGTLPVPCNGTQFYVTVATATINIRPSDGVFNNYVAGTGLQLLEVNAFSLLEVQNTNAFPVVFQIFVGFDQFIDKRIFLALNNTPQVINPTAPTPSALTVINIPDLTNQQFTDINGKKWYAIARTALLIFNPDGGATLTLQKFGALTSTGPAVAMIYPTTSLNLPVSGSYTINAGGGAINAVVSEIYQALAAT